MTGTEPGRVRRALDALFEPVDPASLAAVRVVFGASMLLFVGRYFANGWIDDLYLRPRVFLPWPGLEWIAPWPGRGMYLHFAVLGIAAASITLGLFYRASALVFCAGFTWAHLIDRTNYVNHYYLISLVSLLLTGMPLGRVFSLDVRLGRAPRLEAAPAWCVWMLRFQLGVVYFFAGVAKLEHDWLIGAQPLRAWFAARAEMPFGALLAQPLTAHLFAIAGAAFDLLVPFALLWRRTRVTAYAAVVAFHVVTGILFPVIGMFPWLMIALTTIFFDPGWPRRVPTSLLRRAGRAALPAAAVAAPYARLSRRAWIASALALYALVQVAVPLRFLLHDGDVLWTERGFRFAWRVMLMEKHGRAEFVVRDRDSGEEWRVEPRERLTPLQAFMVSTQPDMILSFARILGDEWRARGHARVAVHAEVEVSLNGRRHRPLIDREADLMDPRATVDSIVTRAAEPAISIAARRDAAGRREPPRGAAPTNIESTRLTGSPPRH